MASDSRDHDTQRPPDEAAAVGGGDEDFLHRSLPAGTTLGGFRINGVVGEGGFGIVYRAFDPTLHREVALKEYLPSQLVSRTPGSTNVSLISPKYGDTFNAGLRSFMNEARMLAHFDHPALVKVHQFWQANRTAYMVMPYYQGPTLKAHVNALAAEGRRPDEAMLRGWLAPLLEALELMHGEQCYHRDIAPDNILLTTRGPLLLDFGAARRVISDMTQALTVILKPGYAPIEQYGDAATMAQGPWTDLYALACVLYFCITGSSPITSIERVMGDPLPKLSERAAGQYSEAFLDGIDRALAVKPADRPQSVAEFRSLLGIEAPVAPSAGVPAAAPKPLPPMPSRANSDAPPTRLAVGPADEFSTGAAAPTRVEAPPLTLLGAQRRRWAWFGAAGLVLAVGAGFAVRRAQHEPREEYLPPAPRPAPVATPAPMPGGAPPVRTMPVGTAPPQATPPGVAMPAPPGLPPVPGPGFKPVPVPDAPLAAPQAPTVRVSPQLGSGGGGGAGARPAGTAPPATAAPPPPPPPPPRSPKCTELLRKGAEQPLTLEEAQILRSQCP